MESRGPTPFRRSLQATFPARFIASRHARCNPIASRGGQPSCASVLHRKVGLPVSTRLTTCSDPMGRNI